MVIGYFHLGVSKLIIKNANKTTDSKLSYWLLGEKKLYGIQDRICKQKVLQLCSQ